MLAAGVGSERARSFAVRGFAGVDGLETRVGLATRALAVRLVAHATRELAEARRPGDEAGVTLGAARLFQAREAGRIADLDVTHRRTPCGQITCPRCWLAVDLGQNRQANEKDVAASHWLDLGHAEAQL
jgi:hypothetical protein